MGTLDHLLDVMSTQHRFTRPIFVALFAVGLAFNGVAVRSTPVVEPQAATTAATLQDLRGVDELKSLFNRDGGSVRLVLLLSPT